MKKQGKKILALALSAVLAASAFPVSAFALDSGQESASSQENVSPEDSGPSQESFFFRNEIVPGEELEATPGSLRVGTANSLYSYISRPLTSSEAITSDDYYISFDYYAPGRKPATYFYIFGAKAADGSNLNIDLQQINEDIQINTVDPEDPKKPLYLKIPGALKYDRWQNIALHFSGNRVSLYLDGVLEKITVDNEEQTYFERPDDAKVAMLYALGDRSSAGANGGAYYDNFRISQDGVLTASEDFNGGKSLTELGWSAVIPQGDDDRDDIAVDTVQNNPPATLSSIQAVCPQTGFKPGGRVSASELIPLVNGTMSDGTAAIPGMGKLSYESSDPATIGIEDGDDGQPSFSFLKEGTSNITVMLTLFGLTRSQTLTIHVSETVSVTGYRISNPSTTLTPGHSEALAYVKTLSNGLTEEVSMSDIPDFSVESSSPDVIRADMTDAGVELFPVGNGDSVITIHYTLDGEETSSSTEFHVLGNSICTGIPSSPLLSHTIKTLTGTPEEIIADEYFISFDYRYASDATMKDFNVWRPLDADGSISGTGSTSYLTPTVLQTGSALSMWITGHNTPFTLTADLTGDVWHNLAFHFKDSKVEVYLDGKAVRFGSSTMIDRGTDFKMPTLGYFGDITGSEINGYAYYDNVKVMQNGTLTTDDAFDDESRSLEDLGWESVSSGSYPNYSDPPLDAPNDALDSLSVLEKQTGFQVGKTIPVDSAVSVTGILKNGRPAIMAMGSLSYQSSDSSVMEVDSGADGAFSMKFSQPGSCALLIQYTLEDVTKSATVPITVSAAAEPYSVVISNTRGYVLNGESVDLAFLAQYNDGTSREIPADQLQDLSVESSDEKTISVEKNESGYSIRGGEENGPADITLTCTIAGREVKTTKTFTNVSVRSIGMKLQSQLVYVGDMDRIAIASLLSDGNSTTEVPFDSITCSFSEDGVAEYSDGRLNALKECSGLTVTVNAVYNGKTYTAADTVDILPLTADKTKSTYYTGDKVAAARENVKEYKWAATMKDTAVAKAERYLASLSYEDMWENITSEGLPRAHAVNEKMGSLVTGHDLDQYGTYPYTFNDYTVDWKITDPSCNVQFPTNDFKAYYEGGLDENGVFRADLAKKSNDELIAKGEPGNLVNLSDLHKDDPDWGVDDGTGYVDPATGEKYTFVAYYNQWYSWYEGSLKNARDALTDAYLYTGGQKYADAVIIMLDRIADVYPDMDLMNWKNQDGYFNGNPGWGKVTDYVWENTLVSSIMKSYDAVFPAIDTMGEEGRDFLRSKSVSQDKTNPDRLKINFGNGVLKQILPAIKAGQIIGNAGMFQATLALAAIVLDHYPETQKMLDFDFQSGNSDSPPITGGNIEGILVDSVSKDGQGNEGSTGYNAGWLSALLNTANATNGYDFSGAADILKGYRLPNNKPLTDNITSDLYKKPKFKKMFYSMFPLLLGEAGNNRYVPNIGDTGQTGKPDTTCINRNELIQGYQVYQDPVLAQVIYLLNGNSSRGLKYDIFTEDPESLAQSVQNAVDQYGGLKLGSSQFDGLGVSVLRDGGQESGYAPSGMSYDFYDLDIDSSTEGVPYRYLPNYYSTFQFQAQKTGDQITFAFQFGGDTSKDYHLFLQHPPSTGIYGYYDVSINGDPVVQNMNFSDDSKMDADVGAVRGLKEGRNTITFQCTGVSPGDPKSFVIGIRTMTLFLPSGSSSEKRENTQRAAWTTYGAQGKHDHKDALSLGLVAYGLDLLPDLGYPQYADESMERKFWVSGTLSHNTVAVDGKQQDNYNKMGKPQNLDDTDFVKLFDVEANGYYQNTSLYKRTTAMVKIDDSSSYLVDLFRVKGGKKQEFSFHAAEGNVTTAGLNLVPRDGTYDGPGTSLGVMPPGESNISNIGYFFLDHVRQDTSPGGQFSVDWNIKDTYNIYSKGLGALTNVHLKLTMLGSYDTVTLATGYPPVKQGNPSSLQYVVVKNEGQSGLDSIFSSVIEPYQGSSRIASIREVPVTCDGAAVSSNDVKACRVTLKNGRVDYIVSSMNTEKTYKIDGKFPFSGFFGVQSYDRYGNAAESYLNNGTVIGSETMKNPSVTGTVADFTKTVSSENSIDITMEEDVDPGKLIGRYIYIDNNMASKNADYKILNATKLENGNVRLSVGDVTTVRSWADDYDFAKGYSYLLSEGDKYDIPLSEDHAKAPTPPPKEETGTPAPPAEDTATYVSDTTRDLSVNGTYQFRITSKNGEAPTFVIGTPGVFEIESVTQIGNDYFFKLRAIGAPGAQAGIYINRGPRLLIATVGSNPSYARLDTGGRLTVKAGGTYQFKVTSAQKPTFVCGNSSVFRVSASGSKGNDYFFKVTAVGKVGDSAGFYVNREKVPRTVGTIVR